MKTKLIIEIETGEKIAVLPEEGTSESDYKEKELVDFRKDYSKDLHGNVVKRIKNLLSKDFLEDDLIDNLEEQYIDGFDELDNYGIKVKVTKEGD